MAKGALCSIRGREYEIAIHQVLKYCSLNGSLFHTQSVDELAGSSSKNDLQCNMNAVNDIGIEAKIYSTPDWMQSSLHYCPERKRWFSKKGKNPDECQKIFDSILERVCIFDGGIPPFMERDITHDEWKDIKKSTTQWNDTYFDIPDNTIQQLYRAKGCHYIQVSNGYGVYHLGEDVCSFGVPEFNIQQKLRIRTKVHSRKNSRGYCSLSVMAACQPKKLQDLPRSPYSLDDTARLPRCLVDLSRDPTGSL